MDANMLITLEEGHVMQMQLLKLVDSNTLFYKHPLCNARRIKAPKMSHSSQSSSS